MKRIVFSIVCVVLFIYAGDVEPVFIPQSEIKREITPLEPLYIEAECIYTGVTNYPPWLAGRDAPWETNVQIPDVYDRDDRVTSMAVDASGRIYVAYEGIYNASPVRYGFGLASSSDGGQTWDNRVFRTSGTTYSERYPEIAITNDGKIYLWGIITGGTFNNYPCFLRSEIGWFNDPDSLAGFTYFSIPYRVYPECVTWGDGHQLVFTQYTVDRTGTTNDSVFCIFSHDTTNYYGFSFQPSGGYAGRTSIGLDVTGTNDTILIHGVEYYNGSDWDVICYLDTLNGSGYFYGWYTTNTNNDRYPSVFCSDGYAYIAYQADVGGGNNDIMFNYSTDYGTSWLGTMIDVANSARSETYPRVYGDGATIGAVYVYGGDSVLFNYSLENGIEGTWLNDPEIVNDDNSVNNSYHSASLLHTSSYWHAAWEDTRNSGTDGIEIYTSRRVIGQGDIAHRPTLLMFDYRSKAPMPVFADKYVYHRTASPIDERLNTIIAQSSPDEFIPVLVMLSKQLNPDYLIPMAEQMTKSERRQFVIDECKTLAAENQQDILSYLRTKQVAGGVKDIVSLWSTNTITLKATCEIIRELADRIDVWEIGYLEPLTLIGISTAEDYKYERVAFIPDNGREVCWGVSKINADDVWPLGYTGAGIVVGHLDSGVNYNHNDLSDHMWDGGVTYPNHGYDFVNDDNNPMDDDGHGTQTAGIVAGDGTSGSKTGVAPDAQIIALKIFPGTSTEIGEGIQFGLDNGADLFSCSVGWENPSNTTKNWCRGQATTLYGAGLVWSCAAGNGRTSPPYGHYSVPHDINSPADCPGPYYAPNGGNSASIAIGATDQSDNVASWSSYGPTSWSTGTYTDYPYPPGLIKPDVAAPGVGIKSLDHTTNSGYDDGINGTSFAQPHLAGTIALMLDRNPALTPRQLDSLIQITAVDIETAGRDNLSGAGRIDALQAINAISEGAQWEQLWVINQPTATGILQVTDITKKESQPWLITISPTQFTVPIEDSQLVWVTADTTGQGLDPDAQYHDTLLIWSNTITEDNQEKVPVVLYTYTTGIEEYEEYVTRNSAHTLTVVPNPSRNSVRIDFSIPFIQNAKLAVYDVCGKKVRTLVDRVYKQGNFSIVWDGTDDCGKRVSAGIYFCRIESQGTALTNKLILLK
jgi:serine protease AprX